MTLPISGASARPSPTTSGAAAGRSPATPHGGSANGDVLVRPGTGADADSVAALDGLCFGTGAWSPSSWAAEFARSDRRVLVAATAGGAVRKPGDTVVGFVALIVPEFAGDPVDLTRIGVAPAVRRTGVAAGLLTAALATVPRRVVLLEVAEGNEAAIALYRLAGFAELSRRRGYYGAGGDALIMRLENTMENDV